MVMVTPIPAAAVGVDPKLEGKLRCIASLLQQLNAQSDRVQASRRSRSQRRAAGGGVSGGRLE